MAWFRREKKGIERAASEESKVRTEGLWKKCDGCRQIVWKKDLDANLSVCPRCQHHYRINARQRLELLFDAGGYTEHDAGLASAARVTFSPTTAPIEPPMKANSIAPICTGRPASSPSPNRMASCSPVFFFAAFRRWS